MAYSVLSYAHAQETYTLSGKAKDMSNTKVELQGFHGKMNIIDSTEIDKLGNFQFRFTDDFSVGLYRIKFSSNKFVDFIFNHENIQFFLSQNRSGKQVPFNDRIKFLTSKENKLYYDFFQAKKRFKRRIALLNELRANYSPQKQLSSTKTSNTPEETDQKSSFYNEIVKEIENLPGQQDEYVQTLIEGNPDMYAVKLIKTLQLPLPVKGAAGIEQKEYIKYHFFDNVDFSDKTLLNSNVIFIKVWGYFDLYFNKQLNVTEQQDTFIKASDIVLSKAKANEEIFSYVLDVLIRRFEKSGYELLFTYLTENYALADSCKDQTIPLSDREKELKERIEIIKKLAVGKPAPEIMILDADSKYQKLTDIKAENTLILFWASWCNHCKSLMPRIKDLYDKYKNKGFDVLAISIDEDRSMWEDAIEIGQYNWINYSELKGWDSKAGKDYNVRITPKMYLLDKEKNIKAKPSTIEELEGLLLTVL